MNQALTKTLTLKYQQNHCQLKMKDYAEKVFDSLTGQNELTEFSLFALTEFSLFALTEFSFLVGMDYGYNQI